MCGKALPLTALLLASFTLQAGAAESTELKDPFFGEALYYAYQHRNFDAIARLDSELTQYYGVDDPGFDTLHYHINQAEFSVGDFELAYRMHLRAGRAISAVIEGNVPPEVRNEAIYRLARLYFQKEQNVEAMHAIERLQGKLPAGLEDDIPFLKGQIYMANGRFTEAEKLFAGLRSEKDYRGFAAYNLGIAFFAQSREADAFKALDEAGQVGGSDRATEAIRDKANLVLGSQLLEKGDSVRAQQYLNRVRLTGPFSNRALLGSGWADIKHEQYDRALVPWSLLIKRDVTDASVQEALLGVPFAYSKLGLYGRSALLYGSALEKISGELEKLDASISSIKEGKFLQALVREEGRSDKEWVIHLRELPQTPETYYLTQLMASNDFQSMLQNYQDMEQLRKRLESWQSYYDAYLEIIGLRHRYYEPLLPSIDAQFRKLDSVIRLRTEQRDSLDKKLHTLLVAPRPDFLATARERIALQHIAALEKRLAKKGMDANTRHRIARLKGLIQWDIQTGYQQRLTEAYEHLAALDKDIAVLQQSYASFVRTRQAATQSYQGYDEQIQRLRIKTENALTQVNTLMLRQGHMLEVMAVNELVRRRQKLEEYQVQARFAMAENYDRAATTKANEEAAKQNAEKLEEAKKAAAQENAPVPPPEGDATEAAPEETAPKADEPQSGGEQ